MDFVDIRLSSADEDAIERLQGTLCRVFPEMRFDRTRIGRNGDWLCDGYFDEGVRRVHQISAHHHILLLGWFRSYETIRAILRRIIPDHPSLRHLDRAMTHMAWHANVDREFWKYRTFDDE